MTIFKSIFIAIAPYTMPGSEFLTWADRALLEDLVLPLVLWASFLPILKGSIRIKTLISAIIEGVE